MANRNFPQSKVFGFHLLPTRIRCAITIGASGAVSSVSGPGTNGVVRTGTGVYRIQLQDIYASFLHLTATMIGQATTGSDINPSAATPGTLYEITIVGTTDWVTAGIPAQVTPTVGQVFALLAAPASATGRVKLSVPSNISQIQVVGSPNNGMMNFVQNTPQSGAYITIMTRGATDASTTTLIPADPASGDVIMVDMLLNNSNVQ